MSWETISKVVGFIALVLGIIYTLRQLWDKKPRLRVDFERTFFPHPSGHTHPDAMSYPTPNLTIRLRNLTERTIKIEKTCFVDGAKRIFKLPNNWQTVDEVPAHDHRKFVISVPDFEKWAKDARMTQPEKGRFVLTDGRGRPHKSEKLKDSMSMAPSKLP
jgi:hypothetical protein